MAIDPVDNVSKRVPALIYDDNDKPLPALIGAIVDATSKEIEGYLPLKVTNNGDGTATLKVDTEIDFTGDLTIGNVKVGSSDGQVSGDKWLKVLVDGTLITRLTDTTGAEIDPATETTLATLLTIAAFQARINTLGQKAMEFSTPVVLASDQSAISITPPSSTTTAVTSVARSAASQTFLVINTSRKGATFHNDSGANLFVKLGAVASVSSFTVRLSSQAYYEVPFGYTGIIAGIWSSGGAGDVRITELT